MKIDDIKPYARNARHNEKAIPIVAQSIAEFGLKGQIVLESRENPVIVAGHTRWEACKSLGWDEIPDERIDYCDDLTDEQIKAYRLADNRTGEVSTWNKALLKTEMRQIKNLDMSKFTFDFKSKTRPYGAERLKTDSYYNLDLCNVDDCAGEFEMPTLEACDIAPTDFMAFNYCKSAVAHGEDTTHKTVHFFIDDYQFERLWTNPTRYIELLKNFECVLTPDFSLYMDMARPVQMYNEYRRRALGHIWQREGLQVIPTLSWTDTQSYAFCFEGLPRGATVATSSVGVHNDVNAKEIWQKGMKRALEVVQPKTLVLYGGRIDGVNFEGVNIIDVETNTGFRKGTVK